MECKKIGFFKKSFALKKEKHEKAKIKWDKIVIMQEELLLKQ